MELGVEGRILQGAVGEYMPGRVGPALLKAWKYGSEWDTLGQERVVCVGTGSSQEGRELSLEKSVGSEGAVKGFASCTVGLGLVC